MGGSLHLRKEKGLWKNQVMLLDMASGRTTDVRKGAPEKTFIRGTRVSPFGHYIILLLRDRCAHNSHAQSTRTL